jgi:soluble lytic murein transglycosylase
MRNFAKFLTFWLALALLSSCTLPAAIVAPPSPTPTPTSTIPPSTPTSVPTNTPTPIVTPAVQIDDGETALFDGDYDRARAAFQSALTHAENETVRAAALWGLSRADYAQGYYVSALVSLKELRDLPSNITPLDAYAWYLTGEILAAQERYQEAADAFAKYITLRPGLIEDAVQEIRGDILFDAEAYHDALEAYQAADAIRDSESLKIKIAATRAALGDYYGALTLYDSIFDATNSDYTKSRLDYLAGKTYLILGETENAWERFHHAVENYPLSYYAYLSLVELVQADIPVDDFQRGLVDYFAGQYDVALLALDRAIENDTESDGNAQYYRALTLRALEKHEEELAAWETFIATYPENPYWEKAWKEKAYTQWAYLEKYTEAANTLLDFVATFPTHEDAPEFLMDAARVLERGGSLDAASQTWARIADEYPSSNLVPRALFLAGIASYRNQDYAQALTHFQRSLLFSTQAEDKARAYLWIGKTLDIQGKNSDAREAWQQGQSLDPTGYYSERARDLLTGAPPFAPTESNLNVDLASEKAEAEAWIRVTFNLPPEANLDDAGTLLNDTRLQRGTEFWNLGEYEKARAEFESLRESVQNNPAKSFQLANYLLDMGLYRPAIFSIRQTLSLAGLESHAASFHAPSYFGHIRYGTYYKDLVLPAAERNDLSPLFLFSVIRQESLFEGFVRSTQGARGLMQIIPSTGSSIANNINFPPNFTPDDLYRPYISIELGAHYLAANRMLLGEDLYGALAAYNAGPGNALLWKEASGNDPDLFLEVIRYQETRDYIRSIYETYKIYTELYQSQP